MLTWDSVANVTMGAVVEEEFALTIDIDDPEHLASFEALLDFPAVRVWRVKIFGARQTPTRLTPHTEDC